jgi:predicted MFS family arabinose efflux permease
VTRDNDSIWPRMPMLLTLWLLMFTASSQFLIVAPILKDIGEALDIAQSVRGTLITGYAVALATFALVAGPISDRFGRRIILRVGTACLAIALLLHSLAFDFASLLALRILAGSASGMMSGAAVAYIGDVMTYRLRGRALGVIMSGMAFGQILGIPGGKVLASYGTFVTPFVVLGVVMLVASVLTWVVLEAPPAREAEPLTLRSAIGNYREILSQRPLAILTVASATMMLSVSAFITYQPTWLEEELGATDWHIATLFAVGGIANAGSGPIAGYLSDIVGRKPMVVGASIFLGIGFLVMVTVPNIYWAYPVMFFTMLAVGARMGPLNAWMTALVSSNRRGSLMSLTMAAGQAGFALGSAGAGLSYTRLGFLGNAIFATMGALVTAGLLLSGVPEPTGDAL